MSARVAKTKICQSGVCDQVHLLVRGHEIEFVSTEQVARVGRHPLDQASMPSDIRLPPAYVMVNDATGDILSKCDIYVVKWHQNAGSSVAGIDQNDLIVARDYFGKRAPLSVGEVDLPKGPWKLVCQVEFIRYRRYGYSKRFEHGYDPPVQLYSTTRPLAWRLPLPEGCVIDSRGFVRP